MRFLHLSDLHFGKTLFEYSLLEDQRHWCLQVLAHLDEAAAPYDAVVIAGDLYDRTVPAADAVDLCDWFLCQLAVERRLPVLCIAGNHDSPSRLQFGSALYREGGLFMAARPRKELQQVTFRDAWGPVHVWLLPYLSPADGKNLFPEAGIRTYQDAYRAMMEENEAQIPWEERNILVAHGFFAATDRDEPGADALRTDSETTLGGVDLVDARLFSRFDYGVLGHLHAPQTASLPQLRYSGSPLAYSVSEEGQQKQILSVTLEEKGHLSIQPVSFTPLRQVRTVSGTMEELLAPTQGGFSSDDYVLVNLLTDTTLLGAAEQIRNVYPHYLAIRYCSTIQQEVALGANAQLARQSLEEAFASFYREVVGRELFPQEETLVQETAQAAREGGRNA